MWQQLAAAPGMPLIQGVRRQPWRKRRRTLASFGLRAAKPPPRVRILHSPP